MRKHVAATVATAAVVSAQLLGAAWNPGPDHPRTAAWYVALRKPRITPPGAVFGLAWTALDALLGYAGYRLLIARPSARRTLALSAWGVNLLGVAGFSAVLFGRKRLDEALAVSAGMIVTAAVAAERASGVDRRATYAEVPLLAWVVFATVLQEELWRRNR